MAQPSLSQLLHGRTNRPPPWVLLIAILPAVLLCIAIGLQPYIDPDDLFRDPITVAQDAAAQGKCCHVYYGFVSQLGILAWAGGSFIALFAAMVLFARSSDRSAWQFMAAIGALTGLLVIDDAFEGHEFVYPRLLGIPEELTEFIYFAILAGILWKYRRNVFKVGTDLLIISLIAFTVSVTTDLFVPSQVGWQRLVEDGSKLIGITTWTTYLWWAAWTLTRHDNDPSGELLTDSR